MSHAYSWSPNERQAASVWRGHPPYLPQRVSALFLKESGPVRFLLHLTVSRRRLHDCRDPCWGDASHDSRKCGNFFRSLAVLSIEAVNHVSDLVCLHSLPGRSNGFPGEKE